MKKQWWLLIVFCSNLYSYEFKRIESADIDAAACSIRNEIERRQRKRFIISCVLAAGAVAGGVIAYKMWPAGYVSLKVEPKKEEPKKESESSPESGKGVGEAPQGGAQDGVKRGVFSSCGRWFRGNLSALIGCAPGAIAYALANTAAGGCFAPVRSALAKLYTALNWEWLREEYLHIDQQFEHLKYISAVLDPHSSEFSLFKDVTINFNDQLLSVYVAREQQHITTFDELVKLKLVAERRITLDQEGILSYQELFARQWNALIDSVTCCLGYIKYCMELDIEVAPFEKSQLTIFRDDMLNATQRLADTLPELVKNVDQKESSGLLATIYEYVNTMQHLSAVLDNNSIIG